MAPATHPSQPFHQRVRHKYGRIISSIQRFFGKGRPNTTFDYWFKALKWYLMNLSFGVFPLLLVLLVRWLTGGRDGNQQIGHLIYEGMVLFVIIAIMGAVAVDYLLSGIKFSGLQVFSIYIFPSCVVGFIALEFLLVCLGKLDGSALGLLGRKTITIVSFSFLYSTCTKATFYMKEDTGK